MSSRLSSGLSWAEPFCVVYVRALAFVNTANGKRTQWKTAIFSLLRERSENPLRAMTKNELEKNAKKVIR